MFNFNFATETPVDLFAEPETVTPAPQEAPKELEEPKELKPCTEDLKTDTREHIGLLTRSNSRSCYDYIFLNKDKVEVESWEVKLMAADGKGVVSLTYGTKEFMIAMIRRTQDATGVGVTGVYAAKFSNMKRKQLEGLNHITLNMQIVKREYGEEDQLITECVSEVDWPKGVALHDLWKSLANTSLELLLGVEPKADDLLIERGDR